MTRLRPADLARLTRVDGAQDASQSHQDAILGGSGASKYRNTPTMVNGLRFDSKKEAQRWQELVLLERAGEIRNLQRQVRIPLAVNGETVAHYIADMVYEDALTGVKTYEDVKGMRTAIYKLKKRLMWSCWGIAIKET